MLFKVLFIYFSAAIILMNHPLPMGITLILMSSLSTIMIFLYSNSSWFAYILFLVMIGGVLILFLYMASLVPNETISTKYIIYPLALMPVVMFLANNFMSSQSFYSMESLNLMFSPPSFPLILILAIYLLLTLIIVVYITKLNKGPLRKIT